MKKRYNFFVLNPNEVSLWRAALSVTEEQLSEFFAVLSPDEIARAEKFKFPIHKQRFIAARGILRCILSYYLLIEPQEIQFSYTAHGKPYIADNDVEFNVSHSHDMAVFAVTKRFPIGVDIEKIKSTYEDAVAKRYFSQQEYAGLQEVSLAQQAKTFYQIWANKEAVIKAMGLGVHYSLESFTVPIKETKRVFSLQLEKTNWSLQTFAAHPDYTAAVVTEQPIEKILYWEWTLMGPQIWK
ncbi:MAG: 4'-phosphopantetheinyl transferase superfamily protein [Gammaproteobacteria bacterium]|nr:4'-phosphopantetheinyl transferase superfamily protein [Gammaproteobacteria bacterium]